MVDAFFPHRLGNPQLHPIDRTAGHRCDLVAPIRQSQAHPATIDRIDCAADRE
jgi:hypothetical protein